jgi:hypothetical protein
MRLDEVQAFISENKHQLGYIMQEASRQWIEMDSSGALTVGPCNIFIKKYGDYHKLQDENEGLKREILKCYRDIEELQQDKTDLEIEFGKKWTKLIKIKQILEEN